MKYEIQLNKSVLFYLRVHVMPSLLWSLHCVEGWVIPKGLKVSLLFMLKYKMFALHPDYESEEM